MQHYRLGRVVSAGSNSIVKLMTVTNNTINFMLIRCSPQAQAKLSICPSEGQLLGTLVELHMVSQPWGMTLKGTAKMCQCVTTTLLFPYCQMGGWVLARTQLEERKAKRVLIQKNGVNYMAKVEKPSSSLCLVSLHTIKFETYIKNLYNHSFFIHGLKCIKRKFSATHVISATEMCSLFSPLGGFWLLHSACISNTFVKQHLIMPVSCYFPQRGKNYEACLTVAI